MSAITKRIRDELERIRLANGGILVPAQVYEAARDDADSPLREWAGWEWDENSAARAYNIIAAGRLIRTVKVTITEETRVIDAPRYVRDPDQPAKDAGYAALLDIRSDEERARGLLAEEFKRASACMRRARDIAHVLKMEDAIDSVEREIASAVQRMGGSQDGAAAH